MRQMMPLRFRTRSRSRRCSPALIRKDFIHTEVKINPRWSCVNDVNWHVWQKVIKLRRWSVNDVVREAILHPSEKLHFCACFQVPWQLRNVIPPSPGFSSPTRYLFLSIKWESFARCRMELKACYSSTITGICSRLATEKFSSDQLHHVLRYWRNFQTTVSMMRIRATPKTQGNGITNDSGTFSGNYINKPIKHVRQTVYRASSLLVARCCRWEKCFTWIFKAYAVLFRCCCCCRWWQASFSTSHSRTSRVMIYSIFEYVFMFSCCTTF